MAPEEFKRKLTAILSADVEGYSRLMGEDEDATIRTLTTYRELMATLIQKRQGRVVDSPGDNLLAEFGSVVDGVRCAVEIQEELRVRNAELPEDRKMVFRIGINLGDVVEEGERIYGDGINIAARVEGLAEGGGICISGTVYDSIKSKLSLSYESMGEHTVKNITEPVRVYRMRVGPEAADRKKAGPKRWRRAAMAGVVALILVIGAVAIWNFYFRHPPMEVASVERMAFPLPDNPSIAVLPFANISEAPKQEYLANGITENIISALSQVPKLFVIARQSTFAFKGKPVKIQQVAEEVGVRYVLEGSVQRSGDNLRITVQLIDAIGGRHLWSERYDRELRNIFALQDEITMRIITALQVKLTDGEQARLVSKGTKNLQAYLKYLQGHEHFVTVTKEGNALARPLFEEAIALDPKYAPAYNLLGATHYMDVAYHTAKSPKQSLAKAMELIQKAIALDRSYPGAHTQLGWLYIIKRKHNEAIAECERAVALDPNGASAYAWLSIAFRYVGRHDESLQAAEKALRLNPIPPGFFFRSLGIAYIFTERHEEAIKTFKKALNLTPNDYLIYLNLAVAYIDAGQRDEAQTAISEVLRLNPKLYIGEVAKTAQYKNKADKDFYINALRKAGLPDKPPLPLPDKPSIAVLPFVNMSGDPEQEYFSDGMTEQIITALSKSPELFVISRSSTFTYKGKSVKAQLVSRDLGVKYVLEGSVQRSGDRLRITAQLIDAIEDHHIWAERYDRELKDVFALQDEITVKIASALRVKLVTGGEVVVQNTRTKNLKAYLKHMEAEHYSMAGGSPDDYALARKLSEEAIALDPEYLPPYNVLAWTHIMDARLGTSKSPRESLGKAFNLAQKVLAMDESDAQGHRTLANVYDFKGEHEKAIAAYERAVALDPNFARGYMGLATALIRVERTQEAILLLKKSMRLSPLSQTHTSMCLFRLGWAYTRMGQYEEALSALKKAANIRPNFWGIQLQLVSTYIHLGREEEARAAAAEVRRIAPKFSLKRYAKRLPLKDQAIKERIIATLREAGLK